MKKMRWRERPDIVARLVNTGSIKSWKSKHIVLKPNEAVSIVVDGKVRDTLSETTLTNYVGGFGRWLGAKMGMGRADHKLVFALTGPLDLLFPLSGRMMDGSAATGLLNLRVQIVRDDVPKLLNLFHSGPQTITRADLVGMFQAELESRVIIPLLARMPDGRALRGPQFQKELEAMCRTEMRSGFDLAGITLIKAFATTNMTDIERLASYRAEVNAVRARLDVDSEARLAEVERARELTLARIGVENDAIVATAAGKADAALQDKLLGLRKMEETLAVERADAMERQKSMLTKARELAEISDNSEKQRLDAALDAFERIQEAKRVRQQAKAIQATARQAASDQMQKQMMQLAADHGALSPEVVKAFLTEQTEQRAVEVEGIKATAEE